MLRVQVPLLVLALLGAGCVGSTVEPAATAPEAQALPLPLLSRSAEWAHGGAQEAFPIGEPVQVPADAAGLFVDFAATVAGPRGALEVRAVAPDGEEHVVGRFGTLAAPRSGSAWAILEAQPGEWRFVGASRTASEGVLNVTAVPKANLTAAAGQGADRVVVAVVDTGVNPYHEVFQRPGFRAADLPAKIVEAASGAAPLAMPLGRAEDYLATLRGDASLWSSVPAETLVHFEGTNLLGYHVGDAELPRVPVLDRAGHGTAVAHAVTQENADVLVVMVTGDDWDAAVRWAAKQPWIDLLSLSWGPPVNAMGAAFEAVGAFETHEATREAHLAGKVVFGASGNDPTPTFSDTTSGPIWVHAVSGSEADEHGRAVLSGNFVDTVANWTQTLAHHQSLDETRETQGTSFATPTTAGVASRILHEVRQRAGHAGGIQEGALVKTEGLTLTGKDLRDALNATAAYWSTAAYRPQPPEPAAPIAPAPWASMGWGHVDGTLVPAAVDLLLGLAEPPAKPAGAKAWMDAQASLRERTWSG